MFKSAFLIMAAMEGVSLSSFIYPGLSRLFLLGAGLITFWLAFRRLEWGVYLLFGELFFGSRGHLLEHNFGPVSVSLRLVVFVAVFVAWALREILDSRLKIRAYLLGIPSIYWLLLVVIVAGFLQGVISGHGLLNVFLDANGYLYLAILPAVITGIKSRETVINLFQILKAAVVIIALKSLMLFLWFTYGFVGIVTIYHWIIEQDIGEITGTVGSASRIFMQSQFYALVGLFIFGLALTPSSPSYQGGERRGGWFIISAAILSIIIGLSRSFWLGALAGALFAAILIIFYFREEVRRVVKFAAIFVLIIVVELGGLYVLTKIGSGKLSGAISSRIGNPASEAAGSARLLLLPELLSRIRESPIFGKGFGEQVTYKSYLPDRITIDNPEGQITTFAFEWGYLDIILKVGLIGLLIYLFFIARIFREGWKKLKAHNAKFKTLGILSGLVALVVLNVTTPYLNHPLGIGYLLLGFVTFKLTNQRTEEPFDEQALGQHHHS